MDKRNRLCLVITVLFIASIMLGVTVLKNIGKEYVPEKPIVVDKKKEKVYKTYDMYVSINPFVKLTFKAEYETCDDNNDEVCFTGADEIIDYELINDDAKTVYNELDFKGMQVMDVLILLCDTARANKIAYDSVSITTNWDDMYDDEVLKNEIKTKSKYEFNFDIFLDVKEYINDQDIIDDNENDEIVEYIVSFNRDNGDSIIKRKVKEKELVSEIKAGNKSGYTFVEWQLNGKKYDFNTPVTKDITLTAKWKKGETTTTTSVVSGENKQESTIKSTTQPTFTSTIDKINLNENILVTEENKRIYSGSSCGGFYGKYVFVTNASSVLGDYKDYGNSYVAGQHISIKNINYNDYSSDEEYRTNYENACSVVVSDFNNKVGSLVYDTAKENAATSVLEKLKNNKTKGITAFTYSVSNHAFSYEYKYLSMENAKSFGDFGKQFNQLSNISELNDAFKSVTYISDYCMGGCGSSDEPEVKVLNESLCSKYNLTCDRW